MAHVRKQIRDALQAAVGTSGVWGTKVYQMRSFPLPEENAAGLSIYTNQAQYQSQVMGMGGSNQTYTVMLTASLELFVSGDSATIGDSVDAGAAQLEAAIGGDASLGGLVKDVVISEVATDVNTDGGVAIGSCVVTLEITYRVSPTDPETALP